jgi:hypothetical protein
LTRCSYRITKSHREDNRRQRANEQRSMRRGQQWIQCSMMTHGSSSWKRPTLLLLHATEFDHGEVRDADTGRIALPLLLNFAAQIGACPLQLDDNQGGKSVPVPPLHIAMPNGAWILRGSDAASEVFVQHP